MLEKAIIKVERMEEIMENKNLRFIDLTIKEMIFLCSFAKTSNIA